MHEMALAVEMVDAIVAAAGPRTVHRVFLEVGVLSCVSAEALRFAFELAADGTVAQAAALEIRTVPALARCRECGTESQRFQPWGRCECGSLDVEMEGGDAPTLEQLEVG